MNFRENEDAVSPVIGVILMVAITVILAAVIAAFVFGMAGNVEAQKSVAVNVKQIATENLQVTIQGGSDVNTLQYLKVTVDGTAYYSQASGTTLDTTEATTQSDDIGVGAVFVTGDSPLDANSNRVVVVGHFTDGKDQVLVDTTL